MMKFIKCLTGFMIIALLCVVLFCSSVIATEISYNHNATLITGYSNPYPGVYEVRISPNADGNATIGIPSIAKQNNESSPIHESPAIIMGLPHHLSEK